MAELTSIVNVKVDSKVKEIATDILKDLGLNMSTFINMALVQVIKKNGVPFEITNPVPSSNLENALKESDVIEAEYKEGKRKGYNNVSEMLRSILND